MVPGKPAPDPGGTVSRGTELWQGRLAVVTGASSGIGAATAKRLAAAGMRVILVARRLERLQAQVTAIHQAGGRAEALPADLAQEAGRQRLCAEIGARYGVPDVLVNNAGLGWYGFAATMPWQTAWEMVQVNVAALAQFSLHFLPGMQARHSGHIINVGSISGSLPSQGIALYGASKAFVDNFTTALYREVGGTGVRVSVVRAGPVRTEFCEQAAQRENGGHLPTERIGVSAETVAERIWGLLRRPRRVIYVPGWMALTPWVEGSFGWLIDRVGPLLLKRGR